MCSGRGLRWESTVWQQWVQIEEEEGDDDDDTVDDLISNIN